MPRFLRWSAYRLRTKGLIVVALPVLPLAFFWSITAIAFIHRDTPTNSTTRNLAVQAALARVFSALLDADAGARDHLLTDNAEALHRYRAAVDRIPPTLAELNNSIIDPNLRKALETLKEIVSDELEVLEGLTGTAEPGAPHLGERAALNR